MKVMVTGATGCLGSCIVNGLTSAEHHVKALVRKSSDRTPIHPSPFVEFVEGDLADSKALNWVAEKCEAAIHCAASLHFVARHPEEMKAYYDINVGGTQRVLEACIEAGVEHFIHMGSIASMGDFYNIERDETFPCTPESEYGKSKLKSEGLALSYHSKGIQVTVLRPGVIYGAWDRGTVLKMIRYIHSGRFRFIGNGRNYKSLVSRGNVSTAALKLILNPAAYGELFIIVDQEKLTVQEIAFTIAQKLEVKLSAFHIPLWAGYAVGAACDTFGKILPVSLPITFQNVRNLTHSATYSSNKLKEKIGFVPTRRFCDSIDEEIDWYLNVYLKEHG